MTMLLIGSTLLLAFLEDFLAFRWTVVKVASVNIACVGSISASDDEAREERVTKVKKRAMLLVVKVIILVLEWMLIKYMLNGFCETRKT